MAFYLDEAGLADLWEKVKARSVLPQIIVTTNATSTISCTKGGVSYTGKIVADESGEVCTVTFDVPDYGEYHLEARNADAVTATTVLVDMVAQYDIRLIPYNYLFYRGDENEELTGGFSMTSGSFSINGEELVVNGGTAGWLITKNDNIDFTPYSKIAVHVTNIASSLTWFSVYVGPAGVVPGSGSGSTPYAGQSYEGDNRVTGWHYLDISNVTQAGQFYLRGYNGSISVDEIVFEIT